MFLQLYIFTNTYFCEFTPHIYTQTFVQLRTFHEVLYIEISHKNCINISSVLARYINMFDQLIKRQERIDKFVFLILLIDP